MKGKRERARGERSKKKRERNERAFALDCRSAQYRGRGRYYLSCRNRGHKLTGHTHGVSVFLSQFRLVPSVSRVLGRFRANVSPRSGSYVLRYDIAVSINSNVRLFFQQVLISFRSVRYWRARVRACPSTLNG